MNRVIPCYVFDIDGTLANGDHRIHHIIRSDGKPKDWDSYFAAAGKDLPILHIVQIARALYRDHKVIVYVSGRSASIWDLTLVWLNHHGLPPGALYMRQTGDHKDDDLLKIEMLEQIRADGYEPVMAFDDRTRVVNAWRAAGIPCAQVAPGDF
jgi:hypothetical protein